MWDVRVRQVCDWNAIHCRRQTPASHSLQGIETAPSSEPRKRTHDPDVSTVFDQFASQAMNRMSREAPGSLIVTRNEKNFHECRLLEGHVDATSVARFVLVHVKED